MTAILEFPLDLKATTILHHFNALSRTSYNAKDYDTITLGIRAAKATIRIGELYHEVHGWGEPTLTTWNMTKERQQQIIVIQDSLEDLGLEQLHSTVEILVTGGTAKLPRYIIAPAVNILTHTVLESLPILARLRMALWQWQDCLDRAEQRKKVDKEIREAKEERARAAKQPLVYKQFRRVISSFDAPPKPPSTPAPHSRPLSVMSNGTPPATPPASRPGTADPTATAKDVKETFEVQSGVKISWIPFAESDSRYHNNAYIVIHREGRRPKQLYVSLTTRGEGENKRTGVWVRVGGGWREFEGYLRGFLEQGHK